MILRNGLSLDLTNAIVPQFSRKDPPSDDLKEPYTSASFMMPVNEKRSLYLGGQADGNLK